MDKVDGGCVCLLVVLASQLLDLLFQFCNLVVNLGLEGRSSCGICLDFLTENDCWAPKSR